MINAVASAPPPSKTPLPFGAPKAPEVSVGSTEDTEVTSEKTAPGSSNTATKPTSPPGNKLKPKLTTIIGLLILLLLLAGGAAGLYLAQNTNQDIRPQAQNLPVVSPSPNSTQRPAGLPSPLPVASPTPTPSPSPRTSPRPSPTGSTALGTVACNQRCTSNADCANANHICFTASDGVNRCRLATNLNSNTCGATVVKASTTPTTATKSGDLPEELPQSGMEDLDSWIKAGLAALGIGAALLLLM